VITRNDIKFLKSLSLKKYRYKHSQFLVEGLRNVHEAIRSDSKPIKIWTTEIFLDKHAELKNQILDFPYEIIDESLFSEILNTKNPQHIMALVPLNNFIVDYNLIKGNIVVLDGISDPGNMGTLLRTIAWYGIDQVVCSKECVDIYNPKVVRAGMGAHFQIQSIFYSDLIVLFENLNKKKYFTLAATMKGSPHSTIEIKRSWALILGNEANGISVDLQKFIDLSISIPSKSSMESLNVAIAGSIILDRLIH
tara:strand:- start:206 stop:958 length:753 start_codon:yes stop_codon:yes gene_type:complete